MVMPIQEQDDWMTPIISFLKNNPLPNSKAEESKIQARAARFIIIDDVLYRRGYSLPYQCCVTAPEAEYVFKEIHEGICGNHAGARSLAGWNYKQAIIGPLYRRIHFASCKHATNVKGSQT